MSYELLERRVLRLERQLLARSRPYWFARGSTQTLIHNTSTVITCTEEVDSNSGYDPSTGLFTVPTGQDGTYFVCGGFLLSSNTYTLVTAELFISSVSFLGLARETLSGFNGLSIAGLLTVTAGQTISVRGQQSNAALADRALQNDGRHNYFMGWRIV